MKRLMLLLFSLFVIMLLAASCNRLEKEYYSPVITHMHPAKATQQLQDNNEETLDDEENERTVLTPLMPLR